MIEVDEKKIQWSDGMTITDLLKTTGNARFCSVIRLNGRLVSSPHFSTTRIPDKAKIQLLPLVAGG